MKHGDQNGPVVAEYVYDYTGQRIKKIDNGVTTYYIGKHYATQTDGSNTQHTSYYFANGERVSKKDPVGNVYYYHSDHLGGTNVVTDSSGNLVERIRYYPFGEIREGGNEKYSFTGKEKDKLTDFYYYEARYYDSGFEHFTQADSIDPDYYDPQDLNRYAYAGNSPLNFKDPSGFKKEHNDKTANRYLKLSEKTAAKSFDELMKILSKINTHGNRKVIRHLSKSERNTLKGIKKLSGKLSKGLAFYSGGVFVYEGIIFFGNEVLASSTGGKLGKHYTLSEMGEFAEELPLDIGLMVTTSKTMLTENRETRAGFTLGLSEAVHSSTSTDAFMNGFTLGLWGILRQ